MCACVCLHVQPDWTAKDLNKSWFCRIPVHTCVAEYLKWRVHRPMPLGGIPFRGSTYGEIMCLAFTCMPGGVTVGDSGLRGCVPCLLRATIFLYC